MIIKWGNKIKAGSISKHIGAFYDFMPTFAELLGVDVDETDGISFLPVITGDGEQKAHEFLYWEHQGNVAVRMGDWKAIRTGLLKDKDAPLKLYNISSDVAEVNDVAALNPEIAAKAMEIMKREHTVNHDYPLYASERKK
jgi:arylsulfatase A